MWCLGAKNGKAAARPSAALQGEHQWLAAGLCCSSPSLSTRRSMDDFGDLGRLLPIYSSGGISRRLVRSPSSGLAAGPGSM